MTAFRLLVTLFEPVIDIIEHLSSTEIRQRTRYVRASQLVRSPTRSYLSHTASTLSEGNGGHCSSCNPGHLEEVLQRFVVAAGLADSVRLAAVAEPVAVVAVVAAAASAD